MELLLNLERSGMKEDKSFLFSVHLWVSGLLNLICVCMFEWMFISLV